MAMTTPSSMIPRGRARKTLDQWIREAITDEEKEGPCTAISIVHMLGTHEREIYSVKLGGRKWTEQDLANLLRGKAEAYAQDLPGMQHFCVLGFYGGRGEPQAHFPLRIEGDQGIHDGLGTYAPDAKGEKQQSMDFAQAMVQLAYQQTRAMVDQSTRLLDRSLLTEERLRDDNAALLERVIDLVVRQHDKEHERKMDLLKFERATAERKKWLSFAPALINQILGRDIFPQSMADTALVETIADRLMDLPDSEVTKLGSMLPGELWGPLMMRMKEVAEKRVREAEERKAMTPHNPEAEIDP